MSKNCLTILTHTTTWIQGPFYLNPDVVADMREVKIEENGKTGKFMKHLRLKGYTNLHHSFSN